MPFIILGGSRGAHRGAGGRGAYDTQGKMASRNSNVDSLKSSETGSQVIVFYYILCIRTYDISTWAI